MSDLHTLARRLMALDDRLAACMRCGLCQGVCPMFGATMKEADVARGKLALVSNLAHELICDPQAVAGKLDRCLLCGSCEAACPSGVKISEIFFEAREVVNAYLGLHPLKKMIFRFLLPRPELFNMSVRVGAPLQRLVLRRNHDAQETACAPMLSFMLGKRHVRPLALRPLSALVGPLDEPRPEGGLKVAFYPGCMGDKLYVDMARACLAVLRHHKVAVFLPEGLACCGMPALASGDAEGMLRQIAVNLPKLRGDFDYLITPCPTCTKTIASLWPRYAQRLGSLERDAAARLAEKTRDITAFLVDVLKVEALPDGEGTLAVTYHDSCHLSKGLGIRSQPRTLIKASGPCRLVEMNEADRCCGCGGSFNLTHYDLSRRIGQRKRDNIVESGAAVVAAACPACMMQLEDMLSQNHDAVTVRHPVQLYAQHLGLGDGPTA
ncbi:(Fe-S)-binding protein [uncultured Desulfovibrio sp.]|uniref:(Fe-S)-binding protein n=1 Tax=uncultured Desulfovibrio sp. TaxID=167968 RepID=UPI00261FCA96|nr:(Fe-S)-binding protein [uncultured Desulfovibrio sp.]